VNLLVTYLYDLGRDFELHRAIHELCVTSYRKNLAGEWRHVCFEGKFNEGNRELRYGSMLRDVFSKLLELRGNNLLVIDADTLCVRTVEMFGKWDRLTMFNMANARVPYNAFPYHLYLHSAIRYVPAEFDYWEIVETLGIDEYDDAVWAYDQYVWNKMFWAQPGVELERAREYVDPRYCWVPMREYDNLGIPKSEAYIIHFCETRGVQACLARMRAHG